MPPNNHPLKGKPGGSTPKQYGLPAGATDLQDLIEYREMNFALGNIFKACYRRGTCSHSDELRDMRKILWFAQREIDRLEAEEANKAKAPGIDAGYLQDWEGLKDIPGGAEKIGTVLTYDGKPLRQKLAGKTPKEVEAFKREHGRDIVNAMCRDQARYPWPVGQPETD